MRFALALALALVACTPSLDDHSVVLPFSELAAALPDAKPYTPTAKDIARFRGALPSEVPPAIAARAPSYYGQFVGYVDKKGTRWIHGYFMCRLDHDDKSLGRERWQHQLIVVSDGGPCYFNAEWSPDTNAIRDLFVNGDA
jgi:hypothetical protein